MAKGERGFTVLEIMICLAILSGVVVTMLGSLNYHLGLVSYNKELVTASVLGRAKAQETALLGIPRITHGSFEAPMEGFSWDITAEETDFKEIKRLDINISWGVDNDVSFMSYQLED